MLSGWFGHREERKVVDDTEGAGALGSDLPSVSADVSGGASRLDAVFDLVPLGVGILDLHGHMTSANEVLRYALGYSHEELAGRAFGAFIHPDDRQAYLDRFTQLVEGQADLFAVDERLIRKDGGTLWVVLTVSLVWHADGSPGHVISVTQEITGRKLFEGDPRSVGRRSQLQVERVPAIVYVAEPGAHGRWLYVSPQIESILGFTAHEWMADAGLWVQRLDPQDRQSVLLAESALAEEDLLMHSAPEKVYSDTYRLRHRNGSTVWFRDDAMVLWDSDGHATWHGVLVDVTREKDLEEQLEHQAVHDALTGLPNRKLFHDRVDQALRKSPSGQVAVLFIDLDNFKMVNDRFGHASGDQVIAVAARHILSCARGGDTAARVGGDEFALLVEGASVQQVTALADRVIEALNKTEVAFSRQALTIGASIGIAVAGLQETTETLMRDADLAMYEAKRQGRGRHVLYEPSLYATARQGSRLREALRSAVSDEVISLAYQPIVDLNTGVVAGFEALARWSDRQLGDVPPCQFIQIAEETGLIHELGHWVIEQACRDLSDWRSAHTAEVYVSVNVSPLQLETASFTSSVVRSLLEHGLEPSALVLEVTEGMLLVERGRRSLRELRSQGIRVAIDDFGTGYSSLSYLPQLPVDMVKIDQTFLSPLQGNTAHPAFLRAIINLAETVRLVTICEGIENPGQARDLQAAGCGYGQGDFLARPGRLADLPATVELVGRPRVDPDAGAVKWSIES
jgi:diguanylate cyclase (GGDEF)-like protein/PAS domain S-box-containing protein